MGVPEPAPGATQRAVVACRNEGAPRDVWDRSGPLLEDLHRILDLQKCPLDVTVFRSDDSFNLLFGQREAGAPPELREDLSVQELPIRSLLLDLVCRNVIVDLDEAFVALRQVVADDLCGQTAIRKVSIQVSLDLRDRNLIHKDVDLVELLLRQLLLDEIKLRGHHLCSFRPRSFSLQPARSQEPVHLQMA